VTKAYHGTTWQFLPVIGGLVADAIQGVMDPVIAKRFAVDREITAADQRPARGFGAIQELMEEKLCTPQDLLPSV
jgi:sarcosine oxidase / L-pipecolate oxidase